MQVKTETLSKEVVSLLIRGREVVGNQVVLDDNKVMTKHEDNWLLVSVKMPKPVGVVTRPRMTIPEREAATKEVFKNEPTSKLTTRELAEKIGNVSADHLGYVLLNMVKAGAIKRQKRSTGIVGVSVWEYFV